ncbi:hypothetical protein M0Q28_06190 [Patescibacteria group bacterium]|jgi:hypothetical protein|nr:hypothetical protein [Patescibacteria group bacterium]
MTLSFPTLAEQCAERFHARTRTTSVSTIAAVLGAVRDDRPFVRVYVFPDDTTLEATGTGHSRKIETFLP